MFSRILFDSRLELAKSRNCKRFERSKWRSKHHYSKSLRLDSGVHIQGYLEGFNSSSVFHSIFSPSLHLTACWPTVAQAYYQMLGCRPTNAKAFLRLLHQLPINNLTSATGCAWLLRVSCKLWLTPSMPVFLPTPTFVYGLIHVKNPYSIIQWIHLIEPWLVFFLIFLFYLYIF